MSREFSRRTFLKGAGGMLAATWYGLRVEPGLAATAPALHGYPRTFVFRQAEILANLRSYADWSKPFRPFDGLIAKLLQEERTDTVSAANLEYVTRFKQAFAQKFAILHFNGRARRPTFETAGWFAGWWLYQAGALTTQAADSGTDLVQVSTLAPFPLVADGFGDIWADLVITATGSDGKPDFSVAEQVRLLGTDPPTGTLQIQRGCYGTIARAWPAGSYVAAHVTAGPWYRGGDKIWLYNFATSAPPGPQGQSVIDAILAGLQPRFAAGGDLAILDGIELDVFRIGNQERANADADGDGVADQAMSGAVDLYACGLIQYAQRLRTMLGPNRLLMVDGNGGQRPDLATSNGIESEGIPNITDVDQLAWSQGLAVLAYGSHTMQATKVSYGLYKFNPTLTAPALFSRFRLGLAAALLAGSAVSFYDEPIPGSTRGLAIGPDSGDFPNQFTVWDEILGGGGIGRSKWLGAPIGAAVHLAESMPDLYGGTGVDLTPEFVAGIERPGVTLRRITHADGSFLQLTATGDFSIRLPSVSITGPDLTLVIDIHADPLPEFGPHAPRYVYASAWFGTQHTAEQRLPVDPQWNHLVIAFRRLSGSAISLRLRTERGVPLRLRRIKTIASPDLALREFANGVIFANPSDASAAFDLATLLPGRSLRRLRGSANQDPAVNNGQAVAGTLVLPPIDGLLLARADVFP